MRCPNRCRLTIFLFGAGLLLNAAVALFQTSPGYMDADYYLLGGRNLIAGRGFEEQVLWNYLDDPAGLPHPSHGYWLPGASILAAAGLLFAPEGGFAAARWAFVLVAALVPPLTALLAYRLYNLQTPSRRLEYAGLAGALALFPGFYLGFLTTTDSFGLYMVLGAVFLLTLLSDMEEAWKAFLLGGIAGLMLLTRTDGILWLAAAGFLFLRKRPARLLPLSLGFGLVFGPWLVRNTMVFGSPFAPGGARALWWTGYDDLFAYPAAVLRSSRWLASGIRAITAARLRAAGANLVSTVAVNGLVFLFPLIVAGLWGQRSNRAVRAGAWLWLLVFGLMTVVFPFAGARGGYYHAAAALQPLFWAAVPAGLDVFAAWGGRVRGWRMSEAARVFGTGAVVIAALVSGYLGWTRFAADSLRTPHAASPYVAAETVLASSGAAAEEIVMVNNPPGYALVNGRPAIVIPSGGLPVILAAAEAYDAAFLVLGPEQGLDDLYANPQGRPGLKYLGSAGELLVFRFGGGP